MQKLGIVLVAAAFILCLLKLANVIKNMYVLPIVCIILSIYNIITSVREFKKKNKSGGIFLLVSSIFIIAISVFAIVIRLHK